MYLEDSELAIVFHECCVARGASYTDTVKQIVLFESNSLTKAINLIDDLASFDAVCNVDLY